MDALSSSVSALKVPALPATYRESYQFKSSTPYAATTNLPPQPQHAHVTSTSIPTSSVPKTKPFSHKSPTCLVFSSKTSPLNPSSPIFHRNPVTGYATAVVDVAQSNNSLHSVQRDVQRLLKFLHRVNSESSVVDPSTVEELKGQAVRQVVEEEQGNFNRHLVTLLKMLLRKNKVGMVQEVLEEFQRIYDELCGTQVVLVSSKTKMGDDELFGIAKSVHQLSGAVRVKVKNLVHESLPSFAL